jgi:2-(3-amino-3-carboxypropyl)histidine synthase
MTSESYKLHIEQAIEKIKKEDAKLVCIQLPDGLKPKAKEIQDSIESQTGAKIIIWLGSCYGACDWPIGLNTLGIDLLIAWGHSVWRHNTFEGIKIDN